MTAPQPGASLWRRLLWTTAGLLFVALGGIGILVPGLPTTVFFILAAWSFSHSSPRLEAWVLRLPRIGPMVADHRAGLGMPRRAKLMACATIATTVAVSAFVLVDGWLLRFAVLAAGAVGIDHIARRIPTKPVEPAMTSHPDQKR